MLVLVLDVDVVVRPSSSVLTNGARLLLDDADVGRVVAVRPVPVPCNTRLIWVSRDCKWPRIAPQIRAICEPNDACGLRPRTIGLA